MEGADSFDYTLLGFQRSVWHALVDNNLLKDLLWIRPFTVVGFKFGAGGVRRMSPNKLAIFGTFVLYPSLPLNRTTRFRNFVRFRFQHGMFSLQLPDPMDPQPMVAVRPCPDITKK